MSDKKERIMRSGLVIAALVSCCFIFGAPSCDEDCTDEDGDGFCAQNDDCNDTNPAVHPGSDEVCDGVDNDCDGEVDEDYVPYACGEGVCAGESQCADGTEVCIPGDPGPEVCDDGLDNDCDGTIDGADTDCPAACYVEICDGIDNDCDGQVDEGFDLMTDPENCGACATACPETYVCRDGICTACAHEAEVCDDGFDNDCDGLVDMADPDCATCGNGIVEDGEECDDGNSIDGDGCESNCTLSCIAEETPGGVCDLCYDALDNDCDGMIDMADSDCATCPCAPDPEICNDGIDNDCDGTIDGDDPDCPYCTQPPETLCSDALDNDCDGLLDNADPDCAGICGNGIVEAGEECDDGNSINGDGCDNDCTLS